MSSHREADNATKSIVRLVRFLAHVLRDFNRNQGLLLSGALAYYTLLSVVPISILSLIVLSHFIREERLFFTLSTYIGLLIPGYSAVLAEQIRTFVEYRHAIGIVGILAMLFFSSMAFTVLQSAMSFIFLHHARTRHRKFVISAFIPYLYMLSIGLAVVVVSAVTAAIEILEKRHLMLFGWSVSLELAFRAVLYVMGPIAEVAMLTSIYLVMPDVRVRFRHALIGGILATVLWEITRHALVWYYSNLSMVNLIYGSFTTAVVALLTAEAVALILLLGAQVIAELQHTAPPLDNEVGNSNTT